MTNEELERKTKAFNYLFYHLLEWWNSAIEREGTPQDNDFTKLKLLKLQFFISSRNRNLLGLYDSFYALPFGPVESDTFTAINQKIQTSDVEVWNKLQVNFGASSSCFDGEYNPRTFESEFPDLSENIQGEIQYFKDEFPSLIEYDAMRLVQISHRWFAWKHYYSKAERAGRKSQAIPSEAIINEPIKHYE